MYFVFRCRRRLHLCAQLSFFSLQSPRAHRVLHSFPTRRSSDLLLCAGARGRTLEVGVGSGRNLPFYPPQVRLTAIEDRKSTRLNSSHVAISYAVFCLKKKKKKKKTGNREDHMCEVETVGIESAA